MKAIEGKAKGAFAKKLYSVLRKNNVSETQLKGIADDIFSRNTQPGALKKIPREVTQSLKRILTGPKTAAVIVWGRKAKPGLKVFSLEGYQSMQKASSLTASKHKPWMQTKRVKNGKAAQALAQTAPAAAVTS